MRLVVLKVVFDLSCMSLKKVSADITAVTVGKTVR